MLPLGDFQYELPDARIARFPLAERGASRLLVYRGSSITHTRFAEIGDFLPSGSLLVFNNTRVIPARLPFWREAAAGGVGARIELFLLEPVAPSPLLAEALAATHTCTWHCLVGNRKRWKEATARWELVVNGGPCQLDAELIDAEKAWVRFTWQPAALSFAEVLEAAGQLPLPPYLNREATEADRLSYQTVYAAQQGAVAAPTAGLHLTDALLASLRQRGFGQEFLTLHVGAGTFRPVKTANMLDHEMHGEQVIFTRSNVENLRANLGRIIPVGTTSLRALESLYWLGARLRAEAGQAPTGPDTFQIGQFVPYQPGSDTPPAEALEAVLQKMDAENRTQLGGETCLMIVPGYRFRLCNGLITNFHQPGSTLLLLIAALLGPAWRGVYDEALAQEYRFLSYGDSSLLLP